MALNDQNYTHPAIQNEIIQIMVHEIVNTLIQSIKSSELFSVICDGTRDISGDKQESICIKWCYKDLEPHENFIGFYKTANTCNSDLAAM